MSGEKSFPNRIKVSIRFTAKLKRYENIRRIVDVKLDLMLREPLSPGLNFEKLTIPNLYSVRVNDNFRILFSIVQARNEFYYYLHDIGPHDIYRIAESGRLAYHVDEATQHAAECYAMQPVRFRDLNPIMEEPQARRIYDITEIIGRNRFKDCPDEAFDATLDQFLVKSAEQKQIINLYSSHPLLVQGYAGTGKTTCAIFRGLVLAAIPEVKRVIILTYNDYLKRVIEYYVVNLAAINIRKISVCTFEEFLKGFKTYGMRRMAPFLSRSESIRIVKDIVEKYPVNQRVTEIYELIYTIKMLTEFDADRKCHPVYTDETKVRDIIYFWSEHHHLLTEPRIMLEIFKEYQTFLQKNRYRRQPFSDVADITWRIYSQIDKLEAAYFEGLSIIVDEIQDFRPLENEIIFALVNRIKQNKYGIDNRFTAFGDEQQQITLTNFNWNRFERDFHCQLFYLNDNHRNTREIMHLDTILLNKCQATAMAAMPKNQTGKYHGPRPLLFLHDNDSEWTDWLVGFLAMNRVPFNLGIVSEDERIYTILEERFGKDDSEEEIFVLRPDYCKGLEFDDLIIIKLFHTYLSNIRIGVPACHNYHALWHVIISRCRTNLLLYLNSGDLKMIKEKILGDDFENFLNGFDIITDPAQWETSGTEFLKRCEYILPGFSRIILNLQKADAVWDKFRITRNPIYKFRAVRYYEMEFAYDKALHKLEEYAAEANDFRCIADAVYFCMKWKNTTSLNRLLKDLSDSNSFDEVLDYYLSTRYYDKINSLIIRKIYDYFQKPSRGIIKHYNRIFDEKLKSYCFREIINGLSRTNQEILKGIGV